MREVTSAGVVVTGAAQGIGRGIAEVFAERGQTVALWDNDASALRETGEHIRAHDGHCLEVVVDVRSRADVEVAVQETIGQMWPTSLINNVAVHRVSEFIDISDEDWHLVMDTNVHSALIVMQAVARRWIEAGSSGGIVNVTSTDARIHFRMAAAYNASKAALSSLSTSAALALAPYGIRVNELAPGFSSPTGMADRYLAVPGGEERLRARVPLGRACHPREIGAAAYFLCGQEAAYITGAALTVDGGLTPGGHDMLVQVLGGHGMLRAPEVLPDR